jgi:hypothetical protein
VVVDTGLHLFKAALPGASSGEKMVMVVVLAGNAAVYSEKIVHCGSHFNTRNRFVQSLCKI